MFVVVLIAVTMVVMFLHFCVLGSCCDLRILLVFMFVPVHGLG